MNHNLTGKVVIVTGAESGIGRCIVERCIEDGASVTAAGIDVGGLKQTTERCGKLGGKEHIIWAETDVREPASINDMINRTLAKFGRLDAAVANAGIVLGQSPFVDITLDQWDQMMATNLRGVFLFNAGLNSLPKNLLKQH